jgi:hypothetical protein
MKNLPTNAYPGVVLSKETTTTIISAQPGWFIAAFVTGGECGDYFTFYPIIAWEISRSENANPSQVAIYHDVRPLTAIGSLHEYGNVPQMIKRPDGWFEDSDGWYSNATEAIAVLRERMKENDKLGVVR